MKHDTEEIKRTLDQIVKDKDFLFKEMRDMNRESNRVRMTKDRQDFKPFLHDEVEAIMNDKDIMTTIRLTPNSSFDVFSFSIGMCIGIGVGIIAGYLIFSLC